VAIKQNSWTVPAIFPYLQKQAGFSLEDMLGVFNMGVGMAIVVAPHEVNIALQLLADSGEEASEIGEVTAESGVKLLHA